MPQFMDIKGESQHLLRDMLAESVSLFSGLKPQDLDSLLAVSKVIPIKARTPVCHKGELGDALYIVVSGKLKVFSQSEDGREAILAILEDGETFGEMSLLDERPRSASVMAVQDSELLVIQRQKFIDFLESNPKVSISLLGILSQRLRLIDDMMEDMRFLDIHSRLAKTLVRLALQHGRTLPGGSIRIDIKLSQEDLGNLICATRESVNKHLKSWEHQGLLQLTQNNLVIHRMIELQALSLP